MGMKKSASKSNIDTTNDTEKCKRKNIQPERIEIKLKRRDGQDKQYE